MSLTLPRLPLTLPRRVVRGVRLRLFMHRLHRAARRARGPREWVEVSRSLRVGPLSIRPMQLPEEIVELLEVVVEQRPRRVLEIGTARGGTLFLFSRAAADDALLLSVDLPSGPFGGGYPAWKEPLYRSFARPGQRIELLRNDSRDPEVIRHVAARAEGGLDLLYIDGDHAYEGVRHDFETYFPLVAPGGLVALHDIRPGDPEDGGDVPRYWTELVERYGGSHRMREILGPGTSGFGIGLLWK